MLWFNFILGLHFISLCFKLIIIHLYTPKQREIKFKPKITLNHNIYIEDLFKQKKNAWQNKSILEVVFSKIQPFIQLFLRLAAQVKNYPG